jgi:hypothetical protein
VEDRKAAGGLMLGKRLAAMFRHVFEGRTAAML